MALPSTAIPVPPHIRAETGADNARSAVTCAADGALSSAAATIPTAAVPTGWVASRLDEGVIEARVTRGAASIAVMPTQATT